MAEGKKHVNLKGRSEGRARVEGALTVTKFEEYLVNRRVGISSDEAHELQDYVDTLRKRGMSAAEAWSLIISVEAWAQARKAFYVAIAIGVASVIAGLGGLLVTLCR